METDKLSFLQIIKRKEILLFVVLFIAGLSLCGWILGEIIIASVSLKFIPVAPSTALLFFLLSLLHIANHNFKKSLITHSVTSIIVLLAAMFCFLVLTDYIFNFTWDIENIFIVNPVKFGEVPIGRMSPITSILFIFTCISILAGQKHNSDTYRYIGGGFTLLTCFAASVLVIGYLYKAPLLYGSRMIPVALPTAICFLLFSVTLLCVSELKFWTFNLIKQNQPEFQLLKTFLPLVVFMVLLQGFIQTNFSFYNNNPTLTSAIAILIIITLTVIIIIRLSVILGGKLMKAEKVLMESEEKSKAMYQASPDLLFRLNRKGVFRDYKADSKDLYTQFNQTIIGKSVHDITPPEFADLIDRKINATLETGKLQTFEYQLPIPDMDLRDYEARMVVSGVDEVIVTVRDITDRKRAEDKIKLKNEELQKLNAEKDKFFSIIAHDLRGPFSGFLGLTKIMAEELPNLKMAEIQQIAVNMENSATNLYRLLENLLQWAKMQQGLIPFDPVVIQLDSVVSESVEMLMESFKNKGIELTFDIPVDTMVIADINMLQTVIRNLVSNAVKFTPKGGRISLSAKTSDYNSIEISIKDSGIGMSTEMVNNLFRLNVQNNRQGTDGEPSSGLGLLLCKEFIEKLGGKIGVESEEGIGSIFHFTLPHSSEPEEKIVTKNLDLPNKEEDKVIREVSPLKILIAEDDENSQMIISLAVKTLSKEILKVRTGFEAVEACRNHPDIDLILMDIQMPQMDGYEATRQIRQFNKEIIIIAQTAYANKGDREKATGAGCTDYITKPIKKAELVALTKKYFLKNEK